MNKMGIKSLVSITDYSKEKILQILDKAAEFEKNPNQKILDGKVIATLFYEPSTRTRLSFETAVNRLGGRIIGFADKSTTSGTKGETLKDTIKMVSNYADLIVMRNPIEGAARYASEVASVPVVNAGDGANQHPTQTMLDLYSIKKTQGRLDNINICMVGDLKYGRTVHSLLMAMSHFSPTFTFIAPDGEAANGNRASVKHGNSRLLPVNHARMADVVLFSQILQSRYSSVMIQQRRLAREQLQVDEFCIGR